MGEDEDYPPLKSRYLQKDFLPGTDTIVEGLIGKKEWKYSLAKAVMELHDGTQRKGPHAEDLPDTGKPPKIIFVTATSAVPYAIAMKECWIATYPTEQPPKFFLIDVSGLRFGINDHSKQILSNEEKQPIIANEIGRLKEIGEKHEAQSNTAVFDETVISGSTIQRASKQLERAGFRDVNFLHGMWGPIRTDWGINSNARAFARKDRSWIGRIPYNPLVFNINPESREVISDMKIIGQLMAKQILQHSNSPKEK
ncbi:MAG: hypothetical protein Q7S79_01875 [bacterium]|nr:hypothetical protein [bacterium]